MLQVVRGWWKCRFTPRRSQRFRHYGLLAPARKARRLALARRLLQIPQANPLAGEQVHEFMQRVAAIDIQRCAHCKIGRLVLVETLPANRTAREAMPVSRGPP